MKKLYSLLLLCLLSTAIFASTTGKITGQVTDSETGEPLIGANVLISEQGIGTATDINGYYTLLHVPPGSYNLTTNYIGYGSLTYNNVRVMIDLTTSQNFQLNSLALEGESVVIEAKRAAVQKDVASSQRHMTSEEIVNMPVNSVNDAIGLQAGIDGMEIRSGGLDEIVLMMDGITLKDDRTGQPITGIPMSAVKEIMVQSGGFNAEYSDLQSGLVNVVTREGGKNSYSGNVSYRYSPPAPKHFGPSLFDEDAYFFRPYLDDDVAWTGTDNGAWDAYTQARYPSFQGWNVVSEQSLQDDDPSNDLTPTGAKRLFEWQTRREGNITKPDFSIDLGFGGPVPMISQSLGNLRFFASYSGNQEMYLTPMSRDGYRDWVGSIRFTSDINSKVKLTVSALAKEITASTSSETGAPTYFSSIWGVASIFGTNSQQSWKLLYPEYYCLTDINTTLYSAKLTNLINESSYYEGIVEYSTTDYSTNPSPRRDSTLFDIYPGAAEFLTDEGPFGFDDGFTESVAGIFSMGLKSNSRDTSSTSRFKLKFDYTNQINRFNQIKTGLQFEYFDYNMNYGAINPSLPVGRPFSIWHRTPYQVGLYIQDKLEFDGWIASLGIRAEYFDPNTDWYDVNEYDKLLYSSNYTNAIEDQIPTKPAKGNLTFLPRIGISHPISINSKLYFNYGHMRQKFSPDELFGVRRVTGGQMSYIGDPQLPLEKTVAFEMGYDQSLFDIYLLHLSAYYKDKTDQSAVVSFSSADGTVDYYKYENIFYQDIRGFEAELRKTRGDWLSGFVNYTYSIYSSGNFGVRNFYQNPAEQREELANIGRQVQYKPLPRPKVKFNLGFHTPRSFGPRIAGDKLLADWHLSFTGNWTAGAYASYGNVPGIVNNVRWKDTYNVNGKLSKTYHMGNMNVTLLAEAFNFFNFKWLSTTGMAVATAYTEYQESLHFDADVYKEIGSPHLSGDDRLGDYRPLDVEYQPMEYTNAAYDADGIAYSGDEGVYYWVEQEDQYMSYSEADNAWSAVPNAEVQDALDNKAYIYNPPNESLMFLAPRDVFIGIKLSYNF